MSAPGTPQRRRERGAMASIGGDASSAAVQTSVRSPGGRMSEPLASFGGNMDVNAVLSSMQRRNGEALNPRQGSVRSGSQDLPVSSVSAGIGSHLKQEQNQLSSIGPDSDTNVTANKSTTSHKPEAPNFDTMFAETGPGSVLSTGLGVTQRSNSIAGNTSLKRGGSSGDLQKRHDRRKTSTSGAKSSSVITDANETDDLSSATKSMGFMHAELLLKCLIPPLLVMLTFGGKPTLLIMCLGVLLMHTLDMLGSVEGSVVVSICLLVTMWCSLLWGARLLLDESMLNFCLLIVMGAILLYTLVCVLSQYKSILYDFHDAFNYMEHVIFMTLPLYGSALVTWFISIEFGGVSSTNSISFSAQMAQPHLVFAIVYYSYLYFLAAPRVSSARTSFLRPKSNKSSREDLRAAASKGKNLNGTSAVTNVLYQQEELTVKYTLPSTAIQVAVYCLPLIICPLMYCSANYWTVHNYFYPDSLASITTRGRASHVGISVLKDWAFGKLAGAIGSVVFPLILSVCTVEDHFDTYWAYWYTENAVIWSSSKNNTVSSSTDKPTPPLAHTGLGTTLHQAVKTAMDIIKMFGLVCLFFTLETHPVLNDLKGYSGMGETRASLLLLSICLFVGMALLQHRRGYFAQKNAIFLSVFATNIVDKVTDLSGRSGLTISTSDTISFQRKVWAFLHGPFLPRTFVTICLSVAAMLMGKLLRLSYTAYPLIFACVFGCSEYYQRLKNIKTRGMPTVKSWLYWLGINGMVSLAGTCLSVAVLLFCQQTIYYLAFQFKWFSVYGSPDRGENVSEIFTSAGKSVHVDSLGVDILEGILYSLGVIRSPTAGNANGDDEFAADEGGGIGILVFSQLVAWCFCQAVSTPTFVAVTGNDEFGDKASSPWSSNDKNGDEAEEITPEGCIAHMAGQVDNRDVASRGMMWALRLFSIFFTLFNIVIVILELLVREQHWSKYGLAADIVYPSPCMFFTSAITIAAVVHLTRLRRSDMNTLFFNSVLHLLKLLHFVGFPTLGIVTVIFSFCTLTYPFFAYYFSTMCNTMKIGASYDSAEISAEEKNKLQKLGVKVPKQKKIGVFLLLFYFVSGTFGIFLARCNIAHFALVSLFSREVTSIQTDTGCISIWCLFMIALLHTYIRRKSSAARHLQSILLVLGVLCALLSAGVFGPVAFRIDTQSSTFLVVETHQEVADAVGYNSVDRTGLYCMLCIVLALFAGSGVINIRSSSQRIVFALLFSYASAQMLLWWAFPLTFSKYSIHHDFWQFPSLFSHGYTILATCSSLLVVLRLVPTLTSTTGSGAAISISSATRKIAKEYAPTLYILQSVLPLFGLFYATFYSERHVHETLVRSVVFVAAVGSGIQGAAIRICELVIEVSDARTGTGTANAAGAASLDSASQKADVGASIATLCLQCASQCIVWSILLTILSSQLVLNADISVPIASLTLLYTQKRLISTGFGFFPIGIENGSHVHHPLMHSAFISALWWILQGLYALFIHGMMHDSRNIPHQFNHHHLIHSLFSQSDCISFWLNDERWIPVVNLVLLLVPIPGIYMAYRHNKSDSEDLTFIMACLSCVGAIASHSNSIRLLSSLGVVLGVWRSRQIAAINRTSSKLI